MLKFPFHTTVSSTGRLLISIPSYEYWNWERRNKPKKLKVKKKIQTLESAWRWGGDGMRQEVVLNMENKRNGAVTHRPNQQHLARKPWDAPKNVDLQPCPS